MTLAARFRPIEWSDHHLAVVGGGDTVTTRYSAGRDGAYWFDFDPDHAVSRDYFLLACGVGGLWFLFPTSFLLGLAAHPACSRASAPPHRREFTIYARTNRLSCGAPPAPRPFILRFRKRRLD